MKYWTADKAYLTHLKPNHLSFAQVLRMPSWDEFSKNQLLTPSVESWKYTSLKAFSEKVFLPYLVHENEVNAVSAGSFVAGASRLTSVHQTLKDFILHDESLRVFSGGVQDLLNLEKKEGAPVLTAFTDFLDKKKKNVFSDLHNYLADNVRVIRVPKGVQIKNPLHLKHFSWASKNSSSHPFTVIYLEPMSSLEVVEEFLSANQGEHFSQTKTWIYVGSGAQLQYSRICNEQSERSHWGEVFALTERNATFKAYSLDSGSQLSRCEWDMHLLAEGAIVEMYGLYAPKENQHTDQQTSISHWAPNSYSYQLCKGVVSQKARSVFNGRIYIDSQAQQVNSQMLNKNLLLHPSARVDTKPELEVFADDVKAAHGATVGQLSAEEVFYLMSRGISRKKAVEMVAQAFIEEVLYKVTHPGVREYMLSSVSDWVKSVTDSNAFVRSQ